jgi:CubicO group peptidase (beta-lactamase class C family)
MLRLVSLIAGLLLVAGVAAATDVPDNYEPSLKGRVQPYVDRGDFRGVIGVKRDGQPVRLLAFDRAGASADVDGLVDREYMIGSISKQFTAVAILLLAEEGRLSTDDSISEYLPGARNHDRVTIRHLLTHTSGIVDTYSLPSYARTGGESGVLADVVAELLSHDLLYEPGQSYQYSNGGYVLLAAIVERVSGQEFGQFLEDRLFAPLALRRTHHGNAHEDSHRPISGYQPSGIDDVSEQRLQSPAYTAGAGSLWSTASDLLAWSEALHSGALLTPSSYAQLTRVYGNGYGMGISVFERFGRNTLGHDGRIAGYASDLARYSDEAVSIVVLSNIESAARDHVRVAVAASLFGETVEPATLPALAAVPGNYNGLAGDYAFGPGFVVYVRASNGQLLARANNGGESELLPTNEDGWFSRMLYANVCFVRDETGVASELRWGCTDDAPVGRRIED